MIVYYYKKETFGTRHSTYFFISVSSWASWIISLLSSISNVRNTWNLRNCDALYHRHLEPRNYCNVAQVSGDLLGAEFLHKYYYCVDVAC